MQNGKKSHRVRSLVEKMGLNFDMPIRYSVFSWKVFWKFCTTKEFHLGALSGSGRMASKWQPPNCDSYSVNVSAKPIILCRILCVSHYQWHDSGVDFRRMPLLHFRYIFIKNYVVQFLCCLLSRNLYPNTSSFFSLFNNLLKFYYHDILATLPPV